MYPRGNSGLLNISPFLTDEFLDERLTSWFNAPVKFIGYEFVGETGKGDSYLSDVVRLKFHGITEDEKSVNIQVVLKSIPKNIARRKTYRSAEFFGNEIAFYQYVLPVLLQYQSTKNMSDPFENYTKIFAYYSDGENDFLALEDVSLYNYGCPVRQEGIDYEHCQIVLKTFAKFHALSIGLKIENPSKFDEISKKIYETYYSEKHWYWYEKFWNKITSIAINAVETEKLDVKYIDKIKEFSSPKTYQKLSDAATNTRKNGVISHGDSWTTNFLFKYNGNTSIPSDAKMIDFQLARCATPVLDISFFIYACTTQELRAAKFDAMLKTYHETLSKQLKDMGHDIESTYSWKTFLDEFKKYAFFGLAFSFESTPFIVLEPEDAFDLDLMTGTERMDISDVWQIQPYKNKVARQRAAYNIVHAIDNQYI